MTDEHVRTGGEGVSADCGNAASDERTGEALDALFEALADERRRYVLAYLDAGEEDVATVPDLVDHVADEASVDDRERVSVALHHAHLPKLADAGLVEFDARDGFVRYRGGSTVSEWLALAGVHDPDGPRR